MSDQRVEVLGRGRWIQLVSDGGWEYAQRIGSPGIVIILAVTTDDRLILVEQFRHPVQARVIELPAGLVGDRAVFGEEGIEEAARRELLEETGYRAEHLELLTWGPSTPGSMDEILHLLRARDVRRVAEGGGVGGEEIAVHEVPLADVGPWLAEKTAGGLLIDLKVYAGLHFALGGRASR